jgi:hypothetical protein
LPGSTLPGSARVVPDPTRGDDFHPLLHLGVKSSVFVPSEIPRRWLTGFSSFPMNTHRAASRFHGPQRANKASIVSRGAALPYFGRRTGRTGAPALPRPPRRRWCPGSIFMRGDELLLFLWRHRL